jgi:K+-transporting ATPase KdpF subunit
MSVFAAFFRGLLGADESLRQALGDEIVDYILAGMASILLFGYLLYALLRPERF